MLTYIVRINDRHGRDRYLVRGTGWYTLDRTIAGTFTKNQAIKLATKYNNERPWAKSRLNATIFAVTAGA